MSLSRIFHKISHPNVRRSQTVDGEADQGPKSKEHTTGRPPARSLTTPAEHSAFTPCASSSTIVLNTSNPPSEQAGDTTPRVLTPEAAPLPDLPPEIFTSTLADTWEHVKEGPLTRDPLGEMATIKALQEVAGVQEATRTFMPLIKVTVNALEQSEIVHVVQEGIDHFFDGMPVFMNALDTVADLHPFIGVVVMAFKTIYTLELKRRDNERKVIALYVEMRDMMAVLLQLQDIRDDEVIAPDNTSIEDRLKTLIEKTAEDIRACSNACDTYCKKKLLAKVFQGPVWDNKLLSYVTKFGKRRTEFEFALSVHNAQGVDAANAKLGTVDETTKAVNAKMDAMMVMFQNLVSVEQKALADLVEAKGGAKAVRNSDKMLTELDGVASKSLGETSTMRSGTTALEVLREELMDDPDTAVEKNMVVFSRKFEIQKRQIIDELTLVVKRESDRIIMEVTNRAYDRILDKDIHEIWKEMGWRGNVKARHFVLALRDYYVEKMHGQKEKVVKGVSAVKKDQNPDAWAINFINPVRLQPILEAFDDDASGFITVGEMNRFTSVRPRDWSLPHWVAYWAVGWKSTIINYARKIEDIFAKMEAVHAKILPANRQPIDEYDNWVWEAVHLMTSAVKDQELGPSQEKFSSYVEAEEARIKLDLEAVEYVIDGPDTLTLVAGVGRVEKSAFAITYLLMVRHYELMRIATKKVISHREMIEAATGILVIKVTMERRMKELKNIFAQQQLDPTKQFEVFAFGIFKYYDSPSDLYKPEYVKQLDYNPTPYDDSKEDQTIKPSDILKYEYMDQLSLAEEVYHIHTNESYTVDSPASKAAEVEVESPLKDILGQWNGLNYQDENRNGRAGESTQTVILSAAEGERNIKGSGYSSKGHFVLDGSCAKDSDGIIQVNFIFAFGGAYWKKVYFYGQFEPESNTISGHWGVSMDATVTLGRIVYKRVPPQYVVFYPHPEALQENKARALWSLAQDAVLQDVRRKNWSWSYFEQRRNNRKTFISLFVRWAFFGTPLTEEETEEFAAVGQRITPADACFYHSRTQYIKATTAIHENAWCDNCDGRIGGARIACLGCVAKDATSFNTVDLCDAEACVASRVTVETREDLAAPHEPTHHLLKLRTTILSRQFGKVDKKARHALKEIEPVCRLLAAEEPKEDSKVTLTVPVVTQNTRPLSRASKRLSTATTNVGSETVPVCGACAGSLGLPCWYCIHCEDHLYICNACDKKGVPKLERQSGLHNEEHALVRCQAPIKESSSDAPSVDQRLSSLDSRFTELQSNFTTLTRRMENMEKILVQLAEALNASNRITSPTTS